MGNHEYNSKEYYAQEFQMFLQNYLTSKYMILLDKKEIEHHGNRVDFPFLMKTKVRLEFIPQINIKKCNISLDLMFQGNWEGPFQKKIEVLRNKHGKITKKTYQNLMQNIVLEKLKEFIK